jgi:hypothetical protein
MLMHKHWGAFSWCPVGWSNVRFLTALLFTTQTSWNVMVCHWVSSYPMFWQFVLTSCSWSSNFLGLLDCSPRDSVTLQKTCIFYPTSWYSFLNHEPIIILFQRAVVSHNPNPCICTTTVHNRLLYYQVNGGSRSSWNNGIDLPQNMSLHPRRL